jgi:hypothetical protein
MPLYKHPHFISTSTDSIFQSQANMFMRLQPFPGLLEYLNILHHYKLVRLAEKQILPLNKNWCYPSP